MRILIGVIAILMMIVGGICVFDGLVESTDNIMQQIAARVEMLGGIMMFGFGLVALAVCSIPDSPHEIKIKSPELKPVESEKSIVMRAAPDWTSFNCQHCGGKIEFDGNGLAPNEALKVECPHCQKQTTICKP
jgi:hypothetical protein